MHPDPMPQDPMQRASNPLLHIEDQLRAAQIVLEDEPRRKIAAYVALLEKWGNRINLTGARAPEELLRRHVLDCLMLETVPRAGGLTRWIDIGSGGGLPGLLVAIVHPGYEVTLAETVAKKATFLAHAARALRLPNVTVLREDIHRTAAALDAHSRFDGVLARAFADLGVLLKLGGALLRPGGELWAMKGPRWSEELKAAAPALLEPYGPEPEVHPYRLGEGGPEMSVLVFRLQGE